MIKIRMVFILSLCFNLTIIGIFYTQAIAQPISDTSGIIKDKSIKQLIEDLQSPNGEIRRSSFLILSNLTAKYALPEFVQEEEDEFGKAILQAAFQALKDKTEIPDISKSVYDEIVSAFIKATESSDQDMVSAVVYALGSARARAAVPNLINLLKTSTEPRFVAYALGKIGPDAAEAVPYLQEIALKEKNDIHFRWAAVEALGDIRDTKTIPLLADLSADQDEDVRWRSVKAIGKILSKNPELISQNILDALIRNLRDNRGRRVGRTFAAYSLGKIGQKAKVAVPDLIAMLKDENEDHRRAAVNALSRIASDDEKVRFELLTLKNDPSPAVRAAVEQTIESLGKTQE